MDMAINPALLGVMALLFLVGTVLLWFILGKPLTKAMDEGAEKISQAASKKLRRPKRKWKN
ncbi:MAG: hypothetical protein U5N86_03325 [Planctomycetota bacterium]|nr:hypothetical protein [Planctomycetota bacterium]